MHYWADLLLVHGLHCYGNTRNAWQSPVVIHQAHHTHCACRRRLPSPAIKSMRLLHARRYLQQGRPFCPYCGLLKCKCEISSVHACIQCMPSLNVVGFWNLVFFTFASSTLNNLFQIFIAIASYCIVIWLWLKIIFLISSSWLTSVIWRKINRLWKLWRMFSDKNDKEFNFDWDFSVICCAVEGQKGCVVVASRSFLTNHWSWSLSSRQQRNWNCSFGEFSEAVQTGCGAVLISVSSSFTIKCPPAPCRFRGYKQVGKCLSK